MPVEVRVVSLSLSFSRGSLEGDWTDGGQMADRWRTDGERESEILRWSTRSIAEGMGEMDGVESGRCWTWRRVHTADFWPRSMHGLSYLDSQGLTLAWQPLFSN